MPSAACTVVRVVNCPMILTLIGAEVGQMLVVLGTGCVAMSDGGISRPRSLCWVVRAAAYGPGALSPQSSPPPPTGARTGARAGAAAPSRRSVNVTSAIIRRMGAPPCCMSGHRPLVTPAVAEVVDDLFDPAAPPLLRVVENALVLLGAGPHPGHVGRQGERPRRRHGLHAAVEHGRRLVRGDRPECRILHDLLDLGDLVLGDAELWVLHDGAAGGGQIGRVLVLLAREALGLQLLP